MKMSGYFLGEACRRHREEVKKKLEISFPGDELN